MRKHAGKKNTKQKYYYAEGDEVFFSRWLTPAKAKELNKKLYRQWSGNVAFVRPRPTNALPDRLWRGLSVASQHSVKRTAGQSPKIRGLAWRWCPLNPAVRSRKPSAACLAGKGV